MEINSIIYKKDKKIPPQCEDAVVSVFTRDNHWAFSEKVNVEWKAQVPTSVCLFNPKKEKPLLMNSPLLQMGETFFRSSFWRLQLSTTNFHNNYLRTVSLFLWRYQGCLSDSLSENNDNSVGIYSMHILDRNGNPVFTRESGLREFPRGSCVGWRNFAPYEKVLPYIIDGTLHIRLKLELFINVLYFPTDLANEKTITVKYIQNRLKIDRSKLMKSSWPIYQLLIDVGIRNSISLPSAFLLMPNENRNLDDGLTTMLKYIQDGTTPLLTKKPLSCADIAELKMVYSLANFYKIKKLEVDIVYAICSIENVNFDNFVGVFEFIHSNRIYKETEINRILFAKAYNQVRDFFYNNLEEIIKLETFKRALIHASIPFLDFLVEDVMPEPEESRELRMH